MNTKITYRYKKENSILYNCYDEYKLSKDEYFKLYSFFVTYSLCNNQSSKRRTLTDYGWLGNISSNGYKKGIDKVFDINSSQYVIANSSKDLQLSFNQNDLKDGNTYQLTTERAVIIKASEQNNLFEYFRHIRNGLAHGKFVLRYNHYNQKMIVIQDDDSCNVTARMILKIETLLKIIEITDKKHLIG